VCGHCLSMFAAQAGLVGDRELFSRVVLDLGAFSVLCRWPMVPPPCILLVGCVPLWPLCVSSVDWVAPRRLHRANTSPISRPQLMRLGSLIHSACNSPVGAAL
jgi:hypothetical protein